MFTQPILHIKELVDTSNTDVIAAYEERITKLKKEKMIMQEKIQNIGKPRHTLEEMFEHAITFLANP